MFKLFKDFDNRNMIQARDFNILIANFNRLIKSGEETPDKLKNEQMINAIRNIIHKRYYTDKGSVKELQFDGFNGTQFDVLSHGLIIHFKNKIQREGQDIKVRLNSGTIKSLELGLDDVLYKDSNIGIYYDKDDDVFKVLKIAGFLEDDEQLLLDQYKIEVQALDDKILEFNLNLPSISDLLERYEIARDGIYADFDRLMNIVTRLSIDYSEEELIAILKEVKDLALEIDSLVHKKEDVDRRVRTVTARLSQLGSFLANMKDELFGNSLVYVNALSPKVVDDLIQVPYDIKFGMLFSDTHRIEFNDGIAEVFTNKKPSTSKYVEFRISARGIEMYYPAGYPFTLDLSKSILAILMTRFRTLKQEVVRTDVTAKSTQIRDYITGGVYTPQNTLDVLRFPLNRVISLLAEIIKLLDHLDNPLTNRTFDYMNEFTIAYDGLEERINVELNKITSDVDLLAIEKERYSDIRERLYKVENNIAILSDLQFYNPYDVEGFEMEFIGTYELETKEYSNPSTFETSLIFTDKRDRYIRVIPMFYDALQRSYPTDNEFIIMKDDIEVYRLKSDMHMKSGVKYIYEFIDGRYQFVGEEETLIKDAVTINAENIMLDAEHSAVYIPLMRDFLTLYHYVEGELPNTFMSEYFFTGTTTITEDFRQIENVGDKCIVIVADLDYLERNVKLLANQIGNIRVEMNFDEQYPITDHQHIYCETISVEIIDGKQIIEMRPVTPQPDIVENKLMGEISILLRFMNVNFINYRDFYVKATYYDSLKLIVEGFKNGLAVDPFEDFPTTRDKFLAQVQFELNYEYKVQELITNKQLIVDTRIEIENTYLELVEAVPNYDLMFTATNDLERHIETFKRQIGSGYLPVSTYEKLHYITSVNDVMKAVPIDASRENYGLQTLGNVGDTTLLLEFSGNEVHPKHRYETVDVEGVVETEFAFQREVDDYVMHKDRFQIIGKKGGVLYDLSDVVVDTHNIQGRELTMVSSPCNNLLKVIYPEDGLYNVTARGSITPLEFYLTPMIEIVEEGFYTGKTKTQVTAINKGEIVFAFENIYETILFDGVEKTIANNGVGLLPRTPYVYSVVGTEIYFHPPVSNCIVASDGLEITMLGDINTVTYFSMYVPAFTANDGVLMGTALLVKSSGGEKTFVLDVTWNILSNSFISFTITNGVIAIDTETVINMGAADKRFYIYYGDDKSVNARFLKNRAYVTPQPGVGYVDTGKETITDALFYGTKMHDDYFLNSNNLTYLPDEITGRLPEGTIIAEEQVARIGVSFNDGYLSNYDQYMGVVAVEPIIDGLLLENYTTTSYEIFKSFILNNTKFELYVVGPIPEATILYIDITLESGRESGYVGGLPSSDVAYIKVEFDRPVSLQDGDRLPLVSGYVVGGPMNTGYKTFKDFRANVDTLYLEQSTKPEKDNLAMFVVDHMIESEVTDRMYGMMVTGLLNKGEVKFTRELESSSSSYRVGDDTYNVTINMPKAEIPSGSKIYFDAVGTSVTETTDMGKIGNDTRYTGTIDGSLTVDEDLISSTYHVKMSNYSAPWNKVHDVDTTIEGDIVSFNHPDIYEMRMLDTTQLRFSNGLKNIYTKITTSYNGNEVKLEFDISPGHSSTIMADTIVTAALITLNITDKSIAMRFRINEEDEYLPSTSLVSQLYWEAPFRDKASGTYYYTLTFPNGYEIPNVAIYLGSKISFIFDKVIEPGEARVFRLDMSNEGYVRPALDGGTTTTSSDIPKYTQEFTGQSYNVICQDDYFDINDWGVLSELATGLPNPKMLGQHVVDSVVLGGFSRTAEAATWAGKSNWGLASTGDVYGLSVNKFLDRTNGEIMELTLTEDLSDENGALEGIYIKRVDGINNETVDIVFIHFDGVQANGLNTDGTSAIGALAGEKLYIEQGLTSTSTSVVNGITITTALHFFLACRRPLTVPSTGLLGTLESIPDSDYDGRLIKMSFSRDQLTFYGSDSVFYFVGGDGRIRYQHFNCSGIYVNAPSYMIDNWSIRIAANQSVIYKLSKSTNSYGGTVLIAESLGFYEPVSSAVELYDSARVCKDKEFIFTEVGDVVDNRQDAPPLIEKTFDTTLTFKGFKSVPMDTMNLNIEDKCNAGLLEIATDVGNITTMIPLEFDAVFLGPLDKSSLSGVWDARGVGLLLNVINLTSLSNGTYQQFNNANIGDRFTLTFGDRKSDSTYIQMLGLVETSMSPNYTEVINSVDFTQSSEYVEEWTYIDIVDYVPISDTIDGWKVILEMPRDYIFQPNTNIDVMFDRLDDLHAGEGSTNMVLRPYVEGVDVPCGQVEWNLRYEVELDSSMNPLLTSYAVSRETVMGDVLTTGLICRAYGYPIKDDVEMTDVLYPLSERGGLNVGDSFSLSIVFPDDPDSSLYLLSIPDITITSQTIIGEKFFKPSGYYVGDTSYILLHTTSYQVNGYDRDTKVMLEVPSDFEFTEGTIFNVYIRDLVPASGFMLEGDRESYNLMCVLCEEGAPRVVDDGPTGVFEELTKHKYLSYMVSTTDSLDVIRYGVQLPFASQFNVGVGVPDDILPLKVFDSILLLESEGGHGLPEGKSVRIVNTLDKLTNIRWVLTVGPRGYEIYKLETMYFGGIISSYLLITRTGDSTCTLLDGGGSVSVQSRPRQYFYPHYSFGFYECFVRGGDLVLDLSMCDITVTKSYMVTIAAMGNIKATRMVVKIDEENVSTFPIDVTNTDSLLIVDMALNTGYIVTDRFPRGQFRSQLNQPFNNTYLTEGQLKLNRLEDLFLPDISRQALANKDRMLDVKASNPFPKDEEGNMQPIRIVKVVEMSTCFAYLVVVNNVSCYVVLLSGEVNDWYRVPVEGFNYFVKYGNASIMAYGNPPRPVVSFSRTEEQGDFPQTKVYSLVKE